MTKEGFKIFQKDVPGIVTNWQPEMALDIYKFLEQPNWAPWLEASQETISGRAKTFPQGQLVILETNTGLPIASLSTNLINWDGNPNNLPNWDLVAGEPTDYSQTYCPKGDTLVLMSMNVSQEYQGTGLARELIGQITQVARGLGCQHLIGSFRPSEFGKYKNQIDWQISFEDYCQQVREDGLPIDGWLRSLARNGMRSLAIDHQAMTVAVTLDELQFYKNNYKPEFWQEISPGIWECGEVGQWQVLESQGKAVYKESNLWGELPL